MWVFPVLSDEGGDGVIVGAVDKAREWKTVAAAAVDK